MMSRKATCMVSCAVLPNIFCHMTWHSQWKSLLHPGGVINVFIYSNVLLHLWFTAALGIPFQPLPDYEEGAELVSVNTVKRQKNVIWDKKIRVHSCLLYSFLIGSCLTFLCRILRWMDTFGWFSAILYKGDNLCDFLLGYLHIKILLKGLKGNNFLPTFEKGSTLKGKTLLCREANSHLLE